MPTALALCTTFLLGTSWYVAECQFNQTLVKRWQLFDAGHRSPLYCQDSLLTLIEQGPTLPCLPPRTDHAAPGQGRAAPSSALCLLIDEINDEVNNEINFGPENPLNSCE